MLTERIRKLTVKYNGRIVGYLAELEDETIAFQYDDEWIKNGFSISPLSLPLTNKIYKDGKTIFNGLYGVFWDSLPDGWGELLVRRMLSTKGINFDKLSPLQKLSIIEKNGLGALEYEPSESLNSVNDDYTLDELAKEADKILNDETDGIDLDKIYNLGGSSGGARPKAHIKYDKEDWIVKFPCRIDPMDIGTKEYEANKIAKQCGINVNECKLFPSKICSGFFGAKRFDRTPNGKVHMISLAALLETSHRMFNLDYSHLFSVVQAISLDKLADMYEVFRRMCFNVFYKNTDDHSKNFSFIYNESKNGYELSPAYDLTSTPNNTEHSMTINGKGNPTENDLLAVAGNFNISIKKCRQIMENVKREVSLEIGGKNE